MPKKDAKAKAAEKKAAKAARQTKKTDKKEKKTKLKSKDEDGSEEEVDLEAVLAEYAKQQEQFLKVTEVICNPPSARSSSTFLGSPANSNELFLFGGEHFNGALATFFNDLYVYNTHRSDWRRVTSPNSPLPRSGHAWTRGGNAGGIYLFGGEFSSPKQGTFYHYNDFWRLDPSVREWSRIETTKGNKAPPVRSGHRMTYYKNYIVLFGGFQDTSNSTKYLADLWLYDTQNYAWHQPSLPPASPKPDARSSFSLLPHDAGAVLYGGYSRVKANTTASASGGASGKAVAATKRNTALKPVVHQDTWFLRIVQPGPEASGSAPPTVRWERRKRPANAPNPPRAGATMAYHKARGICFGGVHDVEESEEGIDSEFFDGLFAWNIERNRFFPLTLRRARAQGKKTGGGGGGGAAGQVENRGGRRGRGKADEEELLRNLARLETRGTLEGGQEDVMDIDAGNHDKRGDEDEEERKEVVILNTFPHPRFNAQLAVQDDVLYIFGGTYEHGDREYTFDEMYAVDLGKLDGVRQVFHRELENWVGSAEGSSDEEEEGDEDEDEDDEDEEEDGVDKMDVDEPPASVATTATANTGMTAVPDEAEVEMEASDSLPSAAVAADNKPYPRPFESLRDFYARTSAEWQEIMMSGGGGSDLANSSIKELKKKGFEIAEGRWWDVREEIMAMEDEQEQAGIGEVVSLGEKGKDGGAGGGGGGGRRR